MSTDQLDDLHREVRRVGSPDRAIALAKYFKTGPGQYGDGDVFIGLTVPQARRIALRFKDLPTEAARQLVASPIHEERLIGLLLLIAAFREGTAAEKQDVYDFYLGNTRHVNNWDLVDTSAPEIVGEYLKDKDRSALLRLAASPSLWERRISMIATFPFIKDLRQHEDAFAVADILLQDEHDLIHKAVGWMLREVGKRISQDVEESFLKSRYSTMPRTALRYAIERFPERLRQAYLRGEV